MFFWNDIPQFITTNHQKKCSEKHFHAGTLLNTNVTLSVLKVKCDHRSKFSNLSNWKEEA